jgi:choloylglycine hydrolase
MKKKLLTLITAAFLFIPNATEACTGITLRTKSGEIVVGRTIEWALTALNSSYTIVPRGFTQRSLVPNGGKEGIEFTARYGYVGLSVEQPEFIMEGVNEAGLSAGLFYFPNYGKYQEYVVSTKHRTISDFQLVAWILGSFKSIDEVKEGMKDVIVVGIDPRSSTVHWRVVEESGRQIVIEIINGKAHFHENTLGVLTNSPSFDWHLTNLNNYVNLFPGSAKSRALGNITLNSIGGGSGLLGIPGDLTPPSRFVRAAFFQTSAPLLNTSEETVIQAFHILNNFDIPIGVQFADVRTIPDIPGATQWTVVTDLKNRCIYYRTMYNAEIRCLDLKSIQFDKVKLQTKPLDETKTQPIRKIIVKR